jgi:diguanylate cyclase (GGDEF)-like protein
VGETVLVVDDDHDVARFVEVNLRSAGFEVTLGADGEEALRRALEIRPDLVLLDVMMPKMDGFEVAKRLRLDPRTASSSIIMLTAKAQSSDKAMGFSSGADGYIIKPFDPIELMAKVRGTLQRAREMRSVSPLTGLPGNVRIQQEIERLVADRQPFAILYADLDNFKALNDYYGFARGDRALKLMAVLAAEVVDELDEPLGFVGHVGGDDFILLVPPEAAERIAGELATRFDRAAPRLYDPGDADNGYIETEDRRGTVTRFPLISLSIGVASTATRFFEHYADAVETATEMKTVAKRQAGSAFAVDRRAG